MILPEAVKAVCEKHQVSQSQDGHQPISMTLAESLTMNAGALPQKFQEEYDHGLPVIPHLSDEDLVDRQRADPELEEVLEYLVSSEKPLGRKTQSAIMVMWMREWNKLEVKNGVLYRRRMTQGRASSQLVLPKDLREMVLTSLHDDVGHLGLERTLDLLRSRFYWPKMADAVERKIKTCERCIRRKAPPQRAAPLVNIQTSRPLELVCMYFLMVEPDNSNIKDILVIRTILQDTLLQYLPKIRRLKLWPDVSGLISYYTMASQKNWIGIRDQISNHEPFKNCAKPRVSVR